ncbi:MAG: hypothetical protein ACI9JN_002818 [Bacteroidia bacterium]|jgi:hypothetical protein
MSKLLEHSAPFVRKLNEQQLITLINSQNKYGGATIDKARTALSTLDPNFKRTGHLLN